MHTKQLVNYPCWPVNDAGDVSFNPRNFTKEQLFQLIKAFNWLKIGEVYSTIYFYQALDLIQGKSIETNPGFLLVSKEYEHNMLLLTKNDYCYVAQVLVAWDSIFIVRHYFDLTLALVKDGVFSSVSDLRWE